MPALHIITGSNGAGKSTIGPDYLPGDIRQHCVIFDGDKLFMQKQRELWSAGITAIKEAKKMAFAFVEETFHSLVEEALRNRSDFVYEGHFTNEATWDIPRKFKAEGYTIHLIYFGLANTKLSELRVGDRVKKGGHYVDPVTVAANFYGNMEKLNEHYAMFDSLQVVDTSQVVHGLLAVFRNGALERSVALSELPIWFSNNLKNLAPNIERK